MYKDNKDFAPDGTQQWYDYDHEYSVEGGDFLVLNKEIVAIGLSQRTTVVGIERFARNILNKSSFKKILVFDIPKKRAFMHLDTVFTMVDYDKFTIHPEITFQAASEGDADLKISLVPASPNPFEVPADSISRIRLSACGAQKMGGYQSAHEKPFYFDLLYQPSPLFAGTDLCRILKEHLVASLI